MSLMSLSELSERTRIFGETKLHHRPVQFGLMFSAPGAVPTDVEMTPDPNDATYSNRDGG
jgi:hypothetical protein